MLSSRLVRLIEEHWLQISERVAIRIKRDPDLVHLRLLPEADLRYMGQNILRNLGSWLIASNWQDLSDRWERLGHRRHEEHMPLYEVIRGLQILKGSILEFIHDRGLPQTTIDIYAEEELERQLGRFFDTVVYHMVKGYETGVPEMARAVNA